MENGGLDRLSPDQLRQIREAGLIELQSIPEPSKQNGGLDAIQEEGIGLFTEDDIPDPLDGMGDGNSIEDISSP